MIVRQSLRSRVVIVVAVVAMSLLAGCGGGGSKDKGTPATAGDNGDVPTTIDIGNIGGGKCFSTPGSQSARVRFVNLFTNDTYPQGDIDVYQGFGANDACGKKLTTVAYGEASDYIDVNALDESGNWETVAYVAGGTEEDKQIITQSETWKGGEQVTIVFANQEANSGNPPSYGSDQAFFEKDTEEPTSAITTVPGKALIGIAATSLQYTLPDESWVAGVKGQSSCLRAVGDTESTRANIGGTQLVQYPVDPGSLELSLYPSDPGNCSGTASIGPVTIDATDGSRTLVFAYGSDKDNLKLLVLPVAS